MRISNTLSLKGEKLSNTLIYLNHIDVKRGEIFKHIDIKRSETLKHTNVIKGEILYHTDVIKGETLKPTKGRVPKKNGGKCDLFHTRR